MEFSVDDESGDRLFYSLKPNGRYFFSNNSPIGIAGIMGGDDTKILNDTTSLIIEA